MSRAHGGSAVAERPRSPARRRHIKKSGDEPRGRPRGSPGGGEDSALPGGPRPVWSGSISFGLVNIPVRLFTAVREQRVAFHLLHDQDKARLRRKIVSSTTGKEIHPEHIVRGYEVAKDKYVVVTQEELEACAPEKTRAIEITDFVHLSEIDPVYYERPYYVLPQKGAARSYRLILAAMKRSKRVGVARVVIHEKEYLAALRPLGDLIVLSTMNLHDEIVPVEPLEQQVSHVHVAEREVKSAEKVIGSMTEKFDPKRYRDEYRDCLLKVIERRAAEEAPVAPPAPAGRKEKASKPHEARAADLMSALEASLARAKNQTKRRKSA